MIQTRRLKSLPNPFGSLNLTPKPNTWPDPNATQSFQQSLCNEEGLNMLFRTVSFPVMTPTQRADAVAKTRRRRRRRMRRRWRCTNVKSVSLDQLRTPLPQSFRHRIEVHERRRNGFVHSSCCTEEDNVT